MNPHIRSMARALLLAASRTLVRPFERRRPPAKKVAIVVPMSDRAELTEEEEISKRQLMHHLGNYDKFILAPQGSRLQLGGFHTKFFPRRFFGSASAHGKLLGTRRFYRAFLDYDYIFFYHFDSLVLSDQLAEWCATGVDYIGPPWIPCDDSPWVDRPRVGNGGFTLLRVESALKVLSNRYRTDASSLWLDLFTCHTPRPIIRLVEKLSQSHPRSWLLRRLTREWHEMENPAPFCRNNDFFWSDRAAHYLSGFKVASLIDGLRFAFEVSPRTCLDLNGGKLPFGCHAWARYDRAFWEPHLVPAGNVNHPMKSCAGS